MDLFIFFALPLATILLAVVLQRILRSPILVAITAFAIYLIVAFAAFSDTLAEALVAVITYTILAFITAYIVQLICELLRKLRLCCRNDNDDISNCCPHHCHRDNVRGISNRYSCCNNDDEDNGNVANDLLTISCNCNNGGSSDLLTVSSNCLAGDLNDNNRVEKENSNNSILDGNTGTSANVTTYQSNPYAGRIARRYYRRY